MSYTDFDENFSLAGKNALITGACSGIGLEIAKMYARKGANIASFDLVSSEELESYAKSLNVKYISCEGDITREEEIQKVVAKVWDGFGKIDILVNSAGVGLVDDADTLSEAMWDKTMAVNLKGTVRMAQAVGSRMIKSGGGKIVNMASQAGVVALERHLAYGVSKAGIIQATKQFAVEWAEHNVNINCISPTVILTPMGEKTWNNKAGDEFKKRIPAKRFGYPKEVAACAVFLASEAASLINGENLVIDGGFTIG